jgi:transposase
MGMVGLKLQDRGWSTAEVVSLFADAGSGVSERTLKRYYHKIRVGDTPLSPQKAAGRPLRLTWEERAVIAGYFLAREDSGLKSTLQTYIDAADRFYSVKMGASVAQRYLEEFDLSSKFMGLRSGKDSRTKNDLIAEALADLQHFHDSGFLSVEACKLWCIDAVTDTRRNERIISYGRKGGTQRKFIGRVPKYTRTIITMVNAEGKQVGPAIFTHNPDLDI